MDYNNYLLKEYEKLGKKPQYYDLCGKKLMVPASYDNIEDFIDNFLAFQDKECFKYESYNKRNPDKQIYEREIKVNNDIRIIVPLSMAKRNLSDKEIVKRTMKKAINRYYDAIEKTSRLNKENIKEKALVSLSEAHFSHCHKEHVKFVTKKIATKIGKALKWSAKQTADVAIGLAGSPILAAYKLLDKKYHWKKNKFSHFLDKQIAPKIKKALLTTAISSAVVLGGKYNNNISQFVENVKKEKQLNQKYKITDKKSFDELFNASFEHIVKSLTLSEVFVADAYSDNGLTVNTVGLGSYYYPCNGNPKSSDWQTVNSYVKKHGNIHIDGQNAVELVDGWFKYREGGRIYKAMQKALMGAELNVCQFSAIATCYYNSEVSGKKVAKFVSENYNNPYACALMFMSVSPNNEFHNGINKRHLHEALKYLNYNDYNEEMDKLLVEKRTAKNGSTFYVTSITQLTPEDCQKFKQALKENNKEVISQICDKIFDYKGKGKAKTIKSIYNTNNMDNAVSEVTMQNVSKSRTISWDNALSIASNSGKSH